MHVLGAVVLTMKLNYTLRTHEYQITTYRAETRSTNFIIGVLTFDTVSDNFFGIVGYHTLTSR